MSMKTALMICLSFSCLLGVAQKNAPKKPEA